MRIKVFKFSFHYASASDIDKRINEFCEKHNVVDIKANIVGVNNDYILYTVIYKE